MAINISLQKLLANIPGSPLGAPFPGSPLEGEQQKIATGFESEGVPLLENQYDEFRTPVVKVTDASLGKYEFCPITIDDGLRKYELPISFLMITGQKGIIETDVIDRGTVFEKVFEKPYDISILVIILSENNLWPAARYKEVAEMYRGKRTEQGREITGRDLVTLKCALTNPFLQPESNFLINKIALQDNGGAENMEIFQIEGRSNIDFELLIN
jgi:hypothetical protein